MHLNELLEKAIQKGASDLHLVVGLSPVLRTDGLLSFLDSSEKLNAKNIEMLVVQILSPEQKKRFLTDLELDFAYQIPSGDRFRVNLFFEKGNMSLAARLVPKTIPKFEELNFDPDLAKFLITKPQGLVLITGPSGSGKSTVMATLLNEINKTRAANIIALEDPIEFLFTSDRSIIRQRELGKDMRSFAEGLKHALRQDPNVIMVGEMRDLETISTTITLAETGHLIFATLHTFDAEQSIDRIINSFPPHQQEQIRMQLSFTLVAVVSQRLVPRQTGGRRIAVREVLINNPAIANLIRENKIEQIKNVMQTGAKEGMTTLKQAFDKLVKQGMVSKEISKLYTD